MQKKSNNCNNKHLLITVSDKQGTRHFKIPKYIKPIVISACVMVGLALVISNTLVFTQKNQLTESHAETASLEDAFVKLSAKISSTNKTLALNVAEKKKISNILAQMEETSGVSGSVNTPLLERLSAVSNHFQNKDIDIDELSGRIGMLEQSIKQENSPLVSSSLETDTPNSIKDTNNEDVALEERVELISLNINQQKLLHDSIPNGYPNQDLGVTSAFGKRIHPTTEESSFHNGVDLKAAEGSQIYATADGVIRQANYNKLSGNRISIAHNYGFETRYAHLSKMQVKAGDVVQKGDIIGLSGNTGRSDGPHLHYEVRYLDKAHNPSDFLAWEFGSQEIFTQVRGIQWQSLISLINKQVSRPTLQLSQLAPE